MANDRYKAGSVSQLVNALTILLNTHTRDDDRVGFVVERATHFVSTQDQSRYMEAWQIVRDSLGYQTAPRLDEEERSDDERPTAS